MGLIQTFQKQGGWKLVSQWMKAGVLPYAIVQIAISGFSRKALELLRNGVGVKVNRKLAKKYLPLLKEWDRTYKEPVVSEKRKVWICWLQGLDSAPYVVQRCVKSIKNNVTDREIVIITSDNYLDYTDFPDYILEKYKQGLISHTHFSDLLRLELLMRHGGTWIDSTVFCSGRNIPNYMLESNFFVFQNLKPGSDGSVTNTSNWFISARQGNRIIAAERYLLFTYWKNHSTIIDYFLFHHFMNIVAEFYSDAWQYIVPYPNSLPHVLLLRMFEPYDENLWKNLKEICPFHKLSYKRTLEEFEKEGTYYKQILEKQENEFDESRKI